MAFTLGTHRGRKMPDCNGTERDLIGGIKTYRTAGSLVQAVLLGPVKSGLSRLRIWGSGVRISSGAPFSFTKNAVGDAAPGVRTAALRSNDNHRARRHYTLCARVPPLGTGKRP